MEHRWSTDQVLELAPDAASRKAGLKLAVPKPWSGTGAGVPEGESAAALWGECAGSGSKPYRTAVQLGAPASTCSCPSRKFPCKHALGLLLLWAGDAAAPSGAAPVVPDGAAPPGWVAEWLAGRREREERRVARAERSAASGGGPGDVEAARRRADRRADRVTAGVEELRRRMADRLHAGLAGEDAAPRADWEEVARRMVDAQAPGLTARVRELAAVPSSGGGWPSRLLEEYGLLHLLASGWTRERELPAPLAATVRTRIGFTTPREGLLAAGGAIRDAWHVLGRSDVPGDNDLTVRRVWLRGRRTGEVALVLGFARPGQALQPALPVGAVVEADVVHHPAARPLRAELGAQHGAAAAGGRPSGVPVREALGAYTGVLAQEPWSESWPVVLDAVVPVPVPEHTGADGADGAGAGKGAAWSVADASGALPLPPGFLRTPGMWRLAAVSAGAPVTVFGEVGHHGFTPVTAWGGAPDEADEAVDLTETTVAVAA